MLRPVKPQEPIIRAQEFRSRGLDHLIFVHQGWYYIYICEATRRHCWWEESIAQVRSYIPHYLTNKMVNFHDPVTLAREFSACAPQAFLSK